jgi:hypothetical protein
MVQFFDTLQIVLTILCFLFLLYTLIGIGLAIKRKNRKFLISAIISFLLVFACALGATYANGRLNEARQQNPVDIIISEE